MAEPSVAGSEPPALVLGGDVTGLAVVRACGRNGVPVYVAGGSRRLVGRSRWYRVAPGGDIGDTADGRELGDYLRTLPFEKSVLIPCSDRWALAASSLPDDVAAAHVPAVAPAAVVHAVVDKVLFARAVADAGVGGPRVLQAEALDSLEADELPSFFVKPKLSQPFSERFGVKALALETRMQAAELLRTCAEAGVDVFLQEYVPGPASSHVFLDGYVDRAGVMRACLARRRLRMHPREFGNSTLTVTIPLPEVSEALDALRRLFESLGYRGLFDAEFKLDARDGRFKILEVNARPWWQLGLAPSVGVDLCLLAYRDALGQPLPRVDGYRVGETWVHPVPDLQAWWRARRTENGAGFPLRFWCTGANAVCSRDDPKPALEELGRAAARCLRRPRRTPEEQQRVEARRPGGNLPKRLQG
jgi:predicted ATP-grasp superfamily ATP-dependent carboligase